MFKNRLILRLAAFVLATTLALVSAVALVSLVESRSKAELSAALQAEGLRFVTLETDGLLIAMTGTAPDEASRFKAISIAGRLIAPGRVQDRMEVKDATGLDPLRFSVEMQRNDDGISLIGLIPTATGRAQILEDLGGLAETAQITDMLETADYPVPEGWPEALAFALNALKDLPRSKISVSPDQASIMALTRSAEEKARVEAALSRAAPDGLRLALEIAAPRPVITPFTLRFSKTADGVAFDACSADTDAARSRILRAAGDAGIEGKTECTIGLGVPSPRWAEAVELAIKSVSELGGGTVTFSDADVSLVALDQTERSEFDRVVGELEAALPPVFSLHSVLPEAVRIDGTGGTDETPEFISTLSPEGLVQLRGRIMDETQRIAVNAYAQALFGTDQVYSATVLDQSLPDGWPVRVLAGLEALGELAHGSLVVQPEFVQLRGTTGNPEAQAEIARILSSKLGEAEDFRLQIRYEEALDPSAALPTPEECVARVNDILAEQKITFDPGSASLSSDARELMDRIADQLRDCQSAPMEIAGYTDSQGREEMNARLSQSRAEAVLSGLLSRRILTENIVAKGYGESDPIADNGTEEGREANRRIEFRLIAAPDAAADAEPETPTGDEASAEDANE